MTKSWLSFVVPAFLLLLFIPGKSVLAQDSVTFQVRMNIKMLEGSFRPDQGDIVTVPGDFNSWSTDADTLSDMDGDSIYTITKSFAASTALTYKFYKTLRNGISWEGDPNRTYTVVAGPQAIPAVYFDRDSVYTPAVLAPVRFRVNMRVKMLEGDFQPDAGDYVRVAGSFNDWGNSLDTLKDLTPTDSIYEKTVDILEGTEIQYKFLKLPARTKDWEDGDNRMYTVPPGGGDLPVAYFNYDSVVNVAVSGNILWQVDMNAMLQLGWFVPGQKDSLEVRGAFNSWGGTKMSENAFTPGTYEVLMPFTGFSGDFLDYKFFMDFDSAGATARFPGYIHSGSTATRDGYAYDHPALLGDGNRRYLLSIGGNIQTPLHYFSDINPKGIINQDDTTRVTLRVNVAPATRYSVPFDYAQDTMFVSFEDALWRSSQSASQGSTFPPVMRMTRNGPTDSIYSLTFLVKGKTYYGLQYRYRYIGPVSGQIDEGGGLGVQNPYRNRFIQPLGPNSFPATYTAPIDEWQKNAPLPAEPAPFDVVNGVEDAGGTLPTGYALKQNYPNPFNPATKIFYSIPLASRVTLTVYNLLGQEVATLVNEAQTPGNYIALFEADRFASGVYFYRLEAGSFTAVKKMMLLK